MARSSATFEEVDPRDLGEEESRMAWLRQTVDAVAREIAWGPLSYEEAVGLSAGAKRAILSRFPTKGEVYELVYAPRFRRLIEARFGKAPGERVLCL
jgi:hypothetical protein